MLESSPASQQSLAETLRMLRRAAGLSGERLAVKTHMSQSKISKIENGKVLPSVTDVDRILRALEVPQQDGNELLQLARIANVESVSRRQIRRIGARQRQSDFNALTLQATNIRYVLPTMLCGLLQTPAYIRNNVFHPLTGLSDDEATSLVAAKLERQIVLYDEKKYYTFILTEAAARVQVASRYEMVEQIEYLIRLSLLPNVTIQIIPLSAHQPNPPLNMFIIYDLRLVLVETEAGATTFRDPVDVNEHEELFVYYQQRALNAEDSRRLLRFVADEFQAGTSVSPTTRQPLSVRRKGEFDPEHRQQEIAAIEESATKTRHVLPVMLTGLLQISEYLSHTSRGRLHLRDDATRDMLIAHRLERQKVLEREDKHFTFLLTEAAVRHMLVPPMAMARQVEHLDSLAGRPNIDIEVIPLARQTVWIPLNVFVVYDDRLVTIETEAGAVVLRDPQEVAEHLELFEHLRLGALKHDECRELLRSIAQEFRERA